MPSAPHGDQGTSTPPPWPVQTLINRIRKSWDGEETEVRHHIQSSSRRFETPEGGYPLFFSSSVMHLSTSRLDRPELYTILLARRKWRSPSSNGTKRGRFRNAAFLFSLEQFNPERNEEGYGKLKAMGVGRNANVITQSLMQRYCYSSFRRSNLKFRRSRGKSYNARELLV